MGGWQAAFSGLGQTGEDLGAGENQALNEALKVRAQLHTEAMDNSHLALAQAQQKLLEHGQQQAWDLAQQHNELARQQLIEGGWQQVGVVKGPDGKYYHQFDNPRKPPGQQTMLAPYEGGVPPDSPEGLVQSYQYYASQRDPKTNQPLFTHRQITEKVLGLHDLYKQGPAAVLQDFREDAKDLHEVQGLDYAWVPGYGNVDIRDANGQEKYGQINADSYWGKGAFLRSSMGLSTKPVDMTGWTANEAREYKAREAIALKKEQAINQLGIVGMTNSLQTMTDMPGAMKNAFDMMNNLTEPLSKDLEDLANQIDARHGRGPAPKTETSGRTWSASAWLKGNPGGNVAAAAALAKLRNDTIVP